MFSFESDAMLVDDREDLIALLQMRFGRITGEMIQRIYAINDMNTLQRLILVAANAPNWKIFMSELDSGIDSYRIIGEDFNPLKELMKGRVDINGEEEK
ncbi:hypothetical protein [Bacillus massilinigeriensis]|uniref:hypothetical protein n=1 Tax=Bacillus massilionigeriensis TaxID=1805475 RepID=UPI00096B2AD7|nr:hypothetical protein [Bacillus massilionigeriensis]